MSKFIFRENPFSLKVLKMIFYEKVSKTCFSWNWFSTILTFIQKETKNKKQTNKKKFLRIFFDHYLQDLQGRNQEFIGGGLLK